METAAEACRSDLSGTTFVHVRVYRTWLRVQGSGFKGDRGTSLMRKHLIKKRFLLGPCSRLMPRDLP